MKKETVVQLTDHVLRIEEVDGQLKVYAHRKSSDGREQLPRAYILGHNALFFEPRNRGDQGATE